jgi:hypothetical protein
MATTEVSICNMALSHLGKYVITALTDDTQEARKCNLYYDFARDFVLRGFPWNFAEKRLALTLLSAVEPTGYDYAYTYPTDCVKARRLYNEVEGGEPIKFVINVNDDLDTKYIYTDEADAILVYTARVEDPTLFDSSFVVALSFYLASLLAGPLGREEMQMNMLKAYAAYISGSEANNASEGFDNNVDNPFVAARG